MTDREIMQQALEALQSSVPPTYDGFLSHCKAMNHIRIRLAQPEQESERNKLAAWMMQRSYATGHGDTVDDLLKELEWQVIEREREACAKVCERWGKDVRVETWDMAADDCAAAIRARGNT